MPIKFGYKQYLRSQVRSRALRETLNNNLDKIIAHDHNGKNSEKIEFKDVKKDKHIIASSWQNLGDGNYSIDVNMPDEIEFDNSIVVLKEADTHEQVFLSTKRINNSKYKILTNNKDLKLYAVYL